MLRKTKNRKIKYKLYIGLMAETSNYLRKKKT